MATSERMRDWEGASSHLLCLLLCNRIICFLAMTFPLYLTIQRIWWMRYDGFQMIKVWWPKYLNYMFLALRVGSLLLNQLHWLEWHKAIKMCIKEKKQIPFVSMIGYKGVRMREGHGTNMLNHDALLHYLLEDRHLRRTYLPLPLEINPGRSLSWGK